MTWREVVPTKDAYAEPEQLIAGMNRRRQLVMFAALAGVILALGGLFAATAAMYAKETTGGLETSKAALQPASTEQR
jgi:hypothetical protein